MKRSIAVLACLICFTSILLADDSPQPDALQAGTNWTGTQEGDKRRPNTPQDKTEPAWLKVTQREGENFTAEYKVGGGRLQLEGQVRAGRVVCKTTKILRGASWEDGTLNSTWTGTLIGNELTMVRTNTKNLTRTARLKLETAEET